MECQCYYPGCPRSYNSKYNLKRHINTNHLHLKSYPCDQCEKSFASKKNLVKHTTTHTEILFEELPMIMQSKRKNGRCVETIDIQSLPLANYYREIVTYQPLNPLISKQGLPSLPSIDSCRQAHQGNSKIPLLPVLLNYANRN